MGAITRALANNITTGGVILPSGINDTSISNITALPDGVGNGLVKLSSVTANNDASIVFDNTVITDTYDTYMLTFRDIDFGTDDVSMYLRVSGDNGSNYISTAVYKRVSMNGEHSDTTNSNMTYKTGGIEQVNLIGAGGTGGTNDKESGAGTCMMFNLRKADRGKVFLNQSFYETAAEKGRLNSGGAYLDDATVINNIIVLPSSGDFNEGTFTLYGFKE